MAESEEGLKSLLMKVESEKPGLKLNIQKTKIMASGPITSWQIDGKQWKQRKTLLSRAPKSLKMVTAATKLKRHLLLGRKAMKILEKHFKKQRCYFANKCPSSLNYDFSSSHIWT